jgi:hypothetical protein
MILYPGNILIYEKKALVIFSNIFTTVFQSQTVKQSNAKQCCNMNIRIITKLPNSEQSYKGKVKTHKYINRQNQSITGKL